MEIKSQAQMEFNLTLKLTEVEARALHAITVYGLDAFRQVFYERMGETYMKPHDAGLKSLFETIGSEIPQHLSRMNNTRKTFNSKL